MYLFIGFIDLAQFQRGTRKPFSRTGMKSDRSAFGGKLIHRLVRKGVPFREVVLFLFRDLDLCLCRVRQEDHHAISDHRILSDGDGSSHMDHHRRTRAVLFAFFPGRHYADQVVCSPRRTTRFPRNRYIPAGGYRSTYCTGGSSSIVLVVSSGTRVREPREADRSFRRAEDGPNAVDGPNGVRRWIPGSDRGDKR